MRLETLAFILLGSSIITLSTGCSMVGGEGLFTSENQGRFTLSADSAGLKEWGKAMNGLVVTGKALPGETDSYWTNQGAETEAGKLRYLTIPGKEAK